MSIIVVVVVVQQHLPKRSDFSFNKIVTTTFGEIAVTTSLKMNKER